MGNIVQVLHMNKASIQRFCTVAAAWLPTRGLYHTQHRAKSLRKRNSHSPHYPSGALLDFLLFVVRPIYRMAISGLSR